MRAPAFWWKEAPDMAARLLAPLGMIYGAVTARRMARSGVPCGIPVICIGNFVAGGAGKTPVAIAVAQALAGLGRSPFFLSRGYGGRAGATPHRVDPGRDGAGDVGDEPLLLAAHAPTFVSADRIAGARACRAAGAELIVMDDGLQNPALSKQLRICVVDGAVGVGNGLCVPAGPLRAPLAGQWPHVDGLVVIGAGAPGEALAAQAAALGKPVLLADLEPDTTAAADLAGRRVLAFAGIGRPEKFFDSLRARGAQVVATRAFADHHPFSAADISDLRAQAAGLDAMPVTTEKDAKRLGTAGAGIATLPVRLAPRDGAALTALLARFTA